MRFSLRAEAALRRNGGRITGARRALLRLIEDSRRPLGPGELHRELRRAGVRAVSHNGVLGDPAGACAEHGRALLEQAVGDLTSWLDGWPA